MVFKRSARAGFTLLEISIVLAIIAVVLGGGIVAFSASLQQRQLQETNIRMQAIQEALYKYRVTYNRLPCPGDITADVKNVNFGKEAAIPGDCFNGAPPTASFANYALITGTSTAGSKVITGMSSTAALAPGWVISAILFPTNTYIVSVDSASQVTVNNAASISMSSLQIWWSTTGGLVPTKALRLPDDYAFDGWGRRMEYIANVSFTRNNAFLTIPVNDTTTRITVKDASGNARSTKAGYVLLSFGANGHGAYPRTGGYTPINRGSTNSDELINCHCNSTGAAATFTTTFVQKMPTQDPSTATRTNDFDDVVIYGTRASLRSSTE